MINIPRGWIVSGVIISASIGMSGCQWLTGYQNNTQTPTQSWAVDLQPTAGEVSLACAGTYHCEFVQIDKTLIVNTDTHTPMPSIEVAAPTRTQSSSPLTNPSTVKATLASASGMPTLKNYYVRMLPEKREVHVDFYPEPNLGYTERFAMIHEFTEPGVYQLKAYRKRSSANSGSLLDTASPEPLCIDLIYHKKVLRHFCKAMNAEHQGEFVETRVPAA